MNSTAAKNIFPFKLLARLLCSFTILLLVFPILFAQSTVPEPPTDCVVQSLVNGEKPIYDAQSIMVKKKSAVAVGESFEILVVLKNTGNTPWFSAFSGCKDQPAMNLGT